MYSSMVQKVSDIPWLLSNFEGIYDRWVLARTQAEKDKIENDVYKFSQNIDDSIYLEISEGNASGLFDPRFFQDDMQKTISVLKSKLPIK